MGIETKYFRCWKFYGIHYKLKASVDTLLFSLVTKGHRLTISLPF